MALIVNVHVIPIIQQYPDECRIKVGLSGWAFITFQRIMRETVMNFENKTKTLPKSAITLANVEGKAWWRAAFKNRIICKSLGNAVGIGRKEQIQQLHQKLFQSLRIICWTGQSQGDHIHKGKTFLNYVHGIIILLLKKCISQMPNHYKGGIHCIWFCFH